MKTTLAALLSPGMNHYRSVGEMARVMQCFLSTAHLYRDTGQWGKTGPTAMLRSRAGCTSDSPENQGWTSQQQGTDMEVTGFEQVQSDLFRGIFGALYCGRPASERWRKEQSISLFMPLKFAMARQQRHEEADAWQQIIALQGHRLDCKTLNPHHEDINVLHRPCLSITASSVSIACSVASEYDIRTGGACASCWNVDFLAVFKNPQWNPRRETFAAFLIRAAAAYRNAGTCPMQRP